MIVHWPVRMLPRSKLVRSVAEYAFNNREETARKRDEEHNVSVEYITPCFADPVAKNDSAFTFIEFQPFVRSAYHDTANPFRTDFTKSRSRCWERCLLRTIHDSERRIYSLSMIQFVVKLEDIFQSFREIFSIEMRSEMRSWKGSRHFTHLHSSY